MCIQGLQILGSLTVLGSMLFNRCTLDCLTTIVVASQLTLSCPPAMAAFRLLKSLAALELWRFTCGDTEPSSLWCPKSQMGLQSLGDVIA